MPEFVNPKYTDGTRTKFKSPTRLECMMQVNAASCFSEYLLSASECLLSASECLLSTL